MMKAATAEDIRTRKIAVSIPGSDLKIFVRRPEPLELISSGLLNLDTFGSVLEQIHTTLTAIQTEATLDNRPVTDPASASPKTYNEFLDRWAVAAAIEPKIVLKEEDAIYDPTSLWVKDLDYDVKAEIFGKTMGVLASDRVIRAVKSFRTRRPDGAGVGPDGPAVRDAAVPVVAGA